MSLICVAPEAGSVRRSLPPRLKIGCCEMPTLYWKRRGTSRP
jgi:hypothetical protein